MNWVEGAGLGPPTCFALLLTFVPRLVRNEKIQRILSEGEHATLRWTMVLLFALLVIAAY
jgi:hypothetical protein